MVVFVGWQWLGKEGLEEIVFDYMVVFVGWQWLG